MQLVKVGRYTYQWTGDEPLKVGDAVLLPENFVSAGIHGPGPWRGQVTAVGSDYTGPVREVIRRIQSND